MGLSIQNIESELSYAYLHAIASKAGMNCKTGNRHDDNEGIDAVVNYNGPIPETYITDVQIDVQLKATIKDGGDNPDYWTYYLQGVNRYDKLRLDSSPIVKILVVLFLPNNSEEWLKCSQDELILKHAAYWVCLHGAKASDNTTGQTIYIPKTNLITPESLRNLAIEIGQNKKPQYPY